MSPLIAPLIPAALCHALYLPIGAAVLINVLKKSVDQKESQAIINKLGLAALIKSQGLNGVTFRYSNTNSYATGCGLFPKRAQASIERSLCDTKKTLGSARFFAKHELSHIKNNDSLQSVLVSIVSSVASLIIFGALQSVGIPSLLALPVLSLPIIALFLHRKWREYEADQFAIRNSSPEDIQETIEFYKKCCESTRELKESTRELEEAHRELKEIRRENKKQWRRLEERHRQLGIVTHKRKDKEKLNFKDLMMTIHILKMKIRWKILFRPSGEYRLNIEHPSMLKRIKWLKEGTGIQGRGKILNLRTFWDILNPIAPKDSFHAYN